MRYETQEKIKKSIKDRKELEFNIMKEYCLAESFKEFMLKCVVKYGWGPKNFFNKYWWHYIITDIGKKKFFTLLLITGTVIGMSCFVLSILFLNKEDSAFSIMFFAFSMCFAIFLPGFLYCGPILNSYEDFNDRLKNVNEKLNGDEDNCQNSSCLSSYVI